MLNFKNFSRKGQGCHTMKTSDLQIVGREKGKETPVKCIVNIFNKIIGENFSNLKKAMLTKVQEACIKGVP